jgi:hypothetical protein
VSGTHILTGEHSRLRRWTLYIFARYVERPLLAWQFVLGAVRRQFRRLLSRERFWLPELPLQPHPEGAV